MVDYCQLQLPSTASSVLINERAGVLGEKNAHGSDKGRQRMLFGQNEIKPKKIRSEVQNFTWPRGFGGIRMLSERHDMCSTSSDLFQQCSLLRKNAGKMLRIFFHACSYDEKNHLYVTFSCYFSFSFIFFFFRDLVILTKFCQTRSIGSPDAFFQFPLKCFQQRLPFLRRKKHFASEGKMGKKREKKITTLESTESPRTIPV